MIQKSHRVSKPSLVGSNCNSGKILLWVTDKILQHCDTRLQLKKERNGIDGLNKYKEDNRNIRALKKPKKSGLNFNAKRPKAASATTTARKYFKL